MLVLWNLQMLVFQEGGKLENLEKNPWSKARTNKKLNPLMAMGQNQNCATPMRGEHCAHHSLLPNWPACENIKFAYGRAYEPSGPSVSGLIMVSVAWGNWEYFYSPLDGMLVHRRVTPSSKFTCTHNFIHLGEERHYESKVPCPRTQCSAPARVWTRTARSRVQRTNH